MRPSFFLALIIIISLNTFARSQCLRCEPNVVTLKGTVYAKDFPGPPNYESIRRGDERMRYWILRLKKPICVEGDDFDNARIANVRELQLVFRDASFYSRYRRYVQRRVPIRVVGSLFHQQTGHHVTKILITVETFAPLRSL